MTSKPTLDEQVKSWFLKYNSDHPLTMDAAELIKALQAELKLKTDALEVLYELHNRMPQMR